MDEKQVIIALAALAHVQRLRVFKALVVAGPAGLMPSVMAQRLEVARSALSFHLKELAHAGLVSAEQQGRHLIYRASFAHMDGLIGYLTEHCCQGGVCEVSSPRRCCLMTREAYNVLFICTGNSARSILAEGLLNTMGGGRFRAWSAGSQPRGEVHPMALATLGRLGVPTAGYRSKHWNEFSADDAPRFDFIFTVCDRAAGEACPVWPCKPMSAHWGVADPAAQEGDEDRCAKAFLDTAQVLRRRIALFMSLPLDRLDALSLLRELRDIGQQ